MKIENQVVNLELAKRLKELGVKQESAFYWKAGYFNLELEWTLIQEIDKSYRRDAWCSAFTVAELGEMLPRECWGADTTAKKCRVWWKRSPVEMDWVADTEADARAKMLIYLIENNLITV